MTISACAQGPQKNFIHLTAKGGLATGGVERNFFENFSVLAGGRCPRDPPVFGWGAKAPPDPPLERSFVTFDRGGQTGPPRSNDFFFGAADDTRAADDRATTARRGL